MAEKIITKRCSKCKEIKTIEEFNKEKSRKDGYCNNCKTCESKRHAAYYKTEKGRKTLFEIAKRHRKTEKFRIYQRAYQQSAKCKAYHKDYQKAYYQSAKYKAYMRRYRLSYPCKIKAQMAIHYAIKYGELPRPDTLKCHYCTEKAQQYHHYKGYGPQHYLDVLPVCRKCHCKIHKKTA